MSSSPKRSTLSRSRARAATSRSMRPSAVDFGEIADVMEQAQGDAVGCRGVWWAISAIARVGGHGQHFRGPFDDLFHRFRFVIIQAIDRAKPCRQGRLRGRTGVVAPITVEPWSLSGLSGPRAFPDHDVEGEVFHRGVEHFFHRSPQSVDFIDEQNITFSQVGEQGGQIPLPFDDWPGGDFDVDAHFVCHDMGERSVVIVEPICDERVGVWDDKIVGFRLEDVMPAT